jgi:adenylate cyclase
LPNEASLAALLGQIQTLAAELDSVKRRLARLEQQRISRERQATPAPLQRATGPGDLPADLADTLKRPRVASAGRLSKAEAARLVANRHNVLFATVRQWPWPPSALQSAEAAEQWAIDYVASIAPHKRPHGWH